MAAWQRDPVSVRFDAGARAVLARAYARPGVWIATRVADPTPRQRLALRSMGVRWNGPDNASATGGAGLNARDRWTRAFVRSVYFQHRWYSGRGQQGWRDQRRSVARSAGAIQVQVGRRVAPTGVIPAGRAVRVRRARGGQAKQTAVRRLPDSARIYADDGSSAARWSDPAARDWL